MLQRAATASRLALLAVLVLPLLVPTDLLAASILPLLLGLLIGLPHGAVDHLVPAWVSVRSRPLSARLGLLLVYAAVFVGALLVFRAAPTPALIGFLAVSILHFGAADEAFHADRDARPVRYRRTAVLAYGGPPVIVPLLLWPGVVDPVLESISPGVSTLLGAELRLLSAAMVGAAVAATAFRGMRDRRPADAVQPVLLVVVFAVVPPPLAFGVYFGGWHALRHIARLLCVDPANAGALDRGRLGPPLLRFAGQAAPPTAVVLLALLLLFAGPASAPEPVPVTAGVVAALTVPHAAMVAWMDHRSGVRKGPFLYRKR